MSESEYRFIPSPYPPRPDYRQVVVDPTLRIPGYAADAKVTGDMLSTKLNLDAVTGKSLELSQGGTGYQKVDIELTGFNTASVGTVPSKGESGKLEWIKAVTELDIKEIEEDIAELNTKVETLGGEVVKLRGDMSANVTYLLAEDKKIRDRMEALNTEIQEKITTIQTKITTIETTIDGLDKRLVIVEKFIQDLEDKFKEIYERLTALETSYAGLVSDISDLKTKIAALETKVDNKADKSDLAELRQVVETKADKEDVTKLEDLITAKLDKTEFNTYKEQINARFDSVDGRIDNIDDTILDINNDIDTLYNEKASKEEVQEIADELDQLEVKVDIHEGRLDSLTTITNTHETRLNQLDNEVVRFVPQSLTDIQKQTARENIGVNWSPEEIEEKIRVLEEKVEAITVKITTIEEDIKKVKEDIGEFDQYEEKLLTITNVLGDPEMYKSSTSTVVTPISQHLTNIYDSLRVIDGGTAFIKWNKQEVDAEFELDVKLANAYTGITTANVEVSSDNTIINLLQGTWQVEGASAMEFDAETKTGSATWEAAHDLGAGTILKLKYKAIKTGFNNVMVSFTTSDPEQAEVIVVDNIRVI